MFKNISKVGIISVIIFVSMLVFSYKTIDINDEVYIDFNTIFNSKVMAQAVISEKNNKTSKTQFKKIPIKASSVLNERLNDPTLFTESDLDILQKLAARRELIDARSEELTLLEGLLGAAEKRIDKKILELKRLIIALKKTIKKK